MAGYLERLKTKKRPPQALQKLQEGENTPTHGTAKTAKSPFYSKCSKGGGHISETPPPTMNDGRFIVTDNLEAHPVAGIVPEFVGVGFDRFKADIEAKGQLIPIVLFQGKILDGRARYRACKELNRPVIARQWEGGMDPVEYITAVNVLRSQEPPDPGDLSQPPAGSTPEYRKLWAEAWTLADWIDDPDGAPIEDRKARLPELNRMRARMAEIEKQGKGLQILSPITN